jgi:hypothetical protein
VLLLKQLALCRCQVCILIQRVFHFYLQVEVGNSISRNNSSSDLKQHNTRRDNIKSKLAPGTEGTMTMVGALESLKEPLVGLVRLAHGVNMPNLMEIQIPVRFIFILFTPSPSPTMDCHEVGRAFSTLMSNKVMIRSTMILRNTAMSLV